jgi:hypothetical protein
VDASGRRSTGRRAEGNQDWTGVGTTHGFFGDPFSHSYVVVDIFLRSVHHSHVPSDMKEEKKIINSDGQVAMDFGEVAKPSERVDAIGEDLSGISSVIQEVDLG